MDDHHFGYKQKILKRNPGVINMGAGSNPRKKGEKKFTIIPNSFPPPIH
jgi:hypothetical protein